MHVAHSHIYRDSAIVKDLRFLRYQVADVIFISEDRPGLIYEQMLTGDTSSHVIDALEEDKSYTVNIYAMYPEGTSESVSVTGRTCKLFNDFCTLSMSQKRK